MPDIVSLPEELRFVRIGRGERWRDADFQGQQIHFGWAEVPHEVLRRKNPDELRPIIEQAYCSKPFTREQDRRTAVSNSLRELRDALEPEKYTWVTIADGHLWWCTATGFGESEETEERGHFYARCVRGWSNKSLGEIPLLLRNLAPSVAVMNRYQGTVCKPRQSASIWRAIRDESDPAVDEFRAARDAYRTALQKIIQKLHYSALEDLADLLFARGGYSRLSRVGGIKKDWDFEALHPEHGEVVAVQVKSHAGQADVRDYEQRFKDAEGYARLYFVVANPRGTISHGPKTVVWDGQKLAELAEQRGLAQWVSEQG